MIFYDGFKMDFNFENKIHFHIYLKKPEHSNLIIIC